MSNNPFDRNKTKEARLGELITEPGEQNQRDAVHIAVVPIIADFNLNPGERVGVTPDGKHSVSASSNPVGIVDPFLTARVRKGETFWLFLFQGQVTTLRHEWTHPAFPSAGHAPVAAPPVDARRAQAERRVREFVATECNWRTLEDFLKEAREAVHMGHGIYMGDNEDVQRYPELLEDICLLTDLDPKDKEGPWFRCAC